MLFPFGTDRIHLSPEGDGAISGGADQAQTETPGTTEGAGTSATEEKKSTQDEYQALLDYLETGGHVDKSGNIPAQVAGGDDGAPPTATTGDQAPIATTTEEQGTAGATDEAGAPPPARTEEETPKEAEVYKVTMNGRPSYVTLDQLVIAYQKSLSHEEKVEEWRPARELVMALSDLPKAERDAILADFGKRCQEARKGKVESGQVTEPNRSFLSEEDRKALDEARALTQRVRDAEAKQDIDKIADMRINRMVKAAEAMGVSLGPKDLESVVTECGKRWERAQTLSKGPDRQLLIDQANSPLDVWLEMSSAQFRTKLAARVSEAERATVEKMRQGQVARPTAPASKAPPMATKEVRFEATTPEEWAKLTPQDREKALQDWAVRNHK